MKTKEDLSPIVLFVYNRPEHTKRTVESLSKNSLAKESRLYIFSDAAKNDAVKEKVDEVRDYIASLSDLNYFSAVVIEEAEENRGLADSIIRGVTKIIKKYGRTIVLEDDLLSGPDFLNFVNQSLLFYEDDSTIGSISGYSPLGTLPKEYQEDIWIASRTSSLGWATWKDCWEDVDWDIKDFETFKKDKKARKRLDECGSDQYDRLRRQMELGADSWAVRFSYWQSRANKNTVFPSATRIQHIGWDGSGVHAPYAGPLDTHIQTHKIEFKLKEIKSNPQIIAMLKSVYSGSITSRIAKYLRNNGFEKVEAMLRTFAGKWILK